MFFLCNNFEYLTQKSPAGLNRFQNTTDVCIFIKVEKISRPKFIIAATLTNGGPSNYTPFFVYMQ